ncbi:MAG: hypothetical protein ACOC7W_04020 [Desulfosalsimonas sp.]
MQNKETITRLANALSTELAADDAQKMAEVINAALKSENVYTEQLPLSEEDRHDCLLMAFEERILIPVRSAQTGSWEDRILRFTSEEMFFMPHVARVLFENACKTGTLDSEAAVRSVLSHHPEEHVEESIKFLKEMRFHSRSCMAEGGLMSAVAQGAGISSDIHDIVDTCVVAGIMSPCTRGSTMQGLAWYEFHPCLYWDQNFQ